jgi:hypothetical protein
MGVTCNGLILDEIVFNNQTYDMEGIYIQNFNHVRVAVDLR